jgi:predicted GIY-YIG superfamily endonuclease
MPAAIERDQQVKRWTRVKKQALIDGRMADLKRLAARGHANLRSELAAGS